ncbi:MAG TPA: ribonuclease HII [Candidatus Paceibacterota bacterium]|nr:ribonuclease HII [Candidatus Paceibacterota bacterium]
MYIVGVDEAGRGPVAGPVAVGIIAVKDGFDILAVFPGLNDSKKLSEKKREALFARLQEQMHAGNVSAVVQFVSASHIDEGGIAPAIRHAVATGVGKLLPRPEEGKVYLDGSLKAPAEYAQETVIGGDGIVPAIMLASIAAKVTRDKHMTHLAETYPAYGFDRHKGYGTKAHYDAIRAHGPCLEHRRTFLKSVL